jgi:glycosyltransferase involved in cell wall biosynthesis
MLSSDALLLISALMPDSENIVPSKLYEYLAAGKPIIALVDPNGRCAEFIRHSNSGYTIAIDDEKSIREAVLNLFFQFKNNGQIKMEQNRNIFDPYERKNLSRCLSDVLDNLIKTL